MADTMQIISTAHVHAGAWPWEYQSSFRAWPMAAKNTHTHQWNAPGPCTCRLLCMKRLLDCGNNHVSKCAQWVWEKSPEHRSHFCTDSQQISWILGILDYLVTSKYLMNPQCSICGADSWRSSATLNVCCRAYLDIPAQLWWTQWVCCHVTVTGWYWMIAHCSRLQKSWCTLLK